MRELLIATGNSGKLKEMVSALGNVPFSIKFLPDCPEGVRRDVEETGSTFEENAILKARTYGDRSGLLTLAEDSGLEVAALGGRPGVYSARYAGGSDEDRYRKLLGELEDVLAEDRGARFRAVVAIYDPKTGAVFITQGNCEGVITYEPMGEGGFGYDPVFYSNELKKTGAQMTVDEKNTISHRGRAMRAARDILLAEFA